MGGRDIGVMSTVLTLGGWVGGGGGCGVSFFTSSRSSSGLLCFLIEINSPLVFQHTTGMTHLRTAGERRPR